jgi:hypothetical protein
MPKYVLAYRGGGMADPSEQEAEMARWGQWFGTLGPAVVDGGNPFGPSTTVGGSDSAGLTGYSIITADSLDAAADAAKGCPILHNGGTVDVYETFDVG